jgi:Protein of unknown function (DUF3025)
VSSPPARPPLALLAHRALLPYFESFEALIGLDAERRVASLNSLAQQIELQNSFDQALSFRTSRGGLKATDYEWAIAGANGLESAYIDTRISGPEGEHDLLNALVWLRFPKTKACLNQLQAQEIAPLIGRQAGLRSTRRDQITLFDENGAILVTQNESLEAALNARDWQGLFLQKRSNLIRDASLHIFGHGLLQKCLSPFKAMTARVWVLHLPPDAKLASIDECLAASISAAWPTWTKRLLPIAGWPGWSDEVQDQAFYSDQKVFRP